MAIKVAFSAGEVSGDEHAAKLCRALQGTLESVSFKGMGGSALKAAGCELHIDCEKLGSVMGIQEVLARYRDIKRSFTEMKQLLSDWHPDLLILVDYPDFNLRLAKAAKSLGIPTLYFIIPKMWAWRQGRVKSFAKYIDHAATIFPFEGDFLTKHGYKKSIYVGHPFSSDSMFSRACAEKAGFLTSLGASHQKRTLTLLLGSRSNEISAHLDLMTEGLKSLKERFPDLQFLVPLTKNTEIEKVMQRLRGINDIFVFRNQSINAMAAGDVGLIKSGTSNLQAVFCDLPFVMFYKIGKISAFLVRLIIQIKEFSIVNILRANTISELLQEDLTPERIVKEVGDLLENSERRAEMRRHFMEIRESLSSFDQDAEFTNCTTPYERTAKLVKRILSETRSE